MKSLIKKVLKEETKKHNFDQVYKKYWNKMLKTVCMKYTDDLDKAKDYCQSGFVKAYNNLHKYDDNGSFEGWIRTVIVRTILDDIRAEKAKQKHFDTGKYKEHAEYLSDEDDYEQVRQYRLNDIMEMIPKLSKNYQNIFNKFFFEQMPQDAIAKELGINIGTVKSNLFKAKERIRQLIDQKYGR